MEKRYGGDWGVKEQLSFTLLYSWLSTEHDISYLFFWILLKITNQLLKVWYRLFLTSYNFPPFLTLTIVLHLFPSRGYRSWGFEDWAGEDWGGVPHGVVVWLWGWRLRSRQFKLQPAVPRSMIWLPSATESNDSNNSFSFLALQLKY